MALRAGQLRHRLELQRATAGITSGTGKPTETWAALDVVWASVEAIAGSERYAELQRQGVVTHVIKIRYWSGLTSKDRAVERPTPTSTEKTYRFHAILDAKGRRAEMEIHAEEQHA